MNKTSSSTVFLKYTSIIFFSAAILYFGKMLFIPLFFGLLTAIVLYPVCKWFERKRVPKSLAITICLSIVALVFGAILLLLSWQLKIFGNDAHNLLYSVQRAAIQLQSWSDENIGLAVSADINWTANLVAGVGNVLKSTIQLTIDTLFMLFLIPVYTALLLYHRKLFVQFLKTVVPLRYQPNLESILQQTIQTYFNYIKGMLFVYLIVAVLNSVGLSALGIRHAVLFGILCAIMTIIPYVGIFLSALLPISVAWLDTGNIWYPLGVVGVFGFVQYLEANIIFPKVVGNQLHVSTLAMLLAIIAGGIIWGAAGMILFIPFVAMLKIVAENIEEWNPISLLIGR